MRPAFSLSNTVFCLSGYCNHIVHIDIFLFDSLSSGAGYCAALSDQTTKLLTETEKVLEFCPKECDSACHDCLQHYWNQRVHTKLDRYAGLELLKWCKDSSMAAPLDFKLQDQLLNPLRLLNAKYSISCDGENHFVEYNGHKSRIYVYPAMWNKRSEYLPQNSITISDKLIKYNLPQADAEIRDAMGIND